MSEFCSVCHRPTTDRGDLDDPNLCNVNMKGTGRCLAFGYSIERARANYLARREADFIQALEDEFAAGREEGRGDLERYREAWQALHAAATARRDAWTPETLAALDAALALDPEKTAVGGEEKR